LTALALVAAGSIAGLINGDTEGGYITAFLMGSVAATFAVVWLRNEKPWAKGVTIVLAVLTVASLFLAAYTEIFWPVALILSGAYLLFTTMRPKAA